MERGTPVPAGPAGGGPPPEHHRVVIEGAGFGGVGLAVRLQDEGVDAYPGCQCDVPRCSTR